jgi:putative transposase
VIVIDRWYPSGKTCSVCGAIVEKLPLDVREWVCRCGARHDRDVNAAKVIHAAGLAVSASGG